jgi:hypothetical protein
MPETSAESATPAQPDEAMTLQEFCTRLSITDRRVEMIGGFHSDETRNGRVKDTEANFNARYMAFVNKPV